MRHEATATCVSWIPPAAVEGVFSLPFDLGVTHAAVRARTSCRLATLSSDQFDRQALLGAAAEAASLLNAWRASHQPI